MIYRGTRLKAYVDSQRGEWARLGEKMAEYQKPRANQSKKGYNINPLYKDDHNINIRTLSALLKCTGLSIDHFVDFEPFELPHTQDGVSGNNNIINSSITTDMTQKIEHLNEVIHLKDELLGEKERIIALKDQELESWKKRYDELIELTKSKISPKDI